MHNVSIIIPTLNEEKYIGGIISDLVKQSLKPYEIIVVDGGSTDTTIKILKEYPALRLLQTNANPALQRDTGAKAANGDILVFLDADTRIAPDFLKNVLKAFSNKNISLACPRYLPIENHLPSTLLYYFFNGVFFLVQKVLPSGAGSCIIVRSKTYKQLEGFESQYRFEDMQFLSKAKGRGFFTILPLTVNVSNRRIKKMGFIKALVLYVRLSGYFIRGDFLGANRIYYPFGNHSSK